MLFLWKVVENKFAFAKANKPTLQISEMINTLQRVIISGNFRPTIGKAFVMSPSIIKIESK